MKTLKYVTTLSAAALAIFVSEYAIAAENPVTPGSGRAAGSKVTEVAKPADADTSTDASAAASTDASAAASTDANVQGRNSGSDMVDKPKTAVEADTSTDAAVETDADMQ